MHYTNPTTEEPLFSWEEPPQLTPAPLWRRIAAGVVDAVGAYVGVIFVFGCAISIFMLMSSYFRTQQLHQPNHFDFHLFISDYVLFIKNYWLNFSWLYILFSLLLKQLSDNQSVFNLVFCLICILCFIFCATFYYTFFDSSRLQGTPGKLLFRLKVSDESGQRLPVKKAFLRSTGKMLTFATLGIGFISLFSNIKRQTWYDKRFKAVVTSK